MNSFPVKIYSQIILCHSYIEPWVKNSTRSIEKSKIINIERVRKLNHF